MIIFKQDGITPEKVVPFKVSALPAGHPEGL
jgi:hypothetical protein